MLIALMLGLAQPAEAKLKVVSTYPYINSLVQEVAGQDLSHKSLTSGAWDPHFIVGKPSLILKLRRADLLIINGAQIEIGWLPPLLRQARNQHIQQGQKGLLDLSDFVTKIQVVKNVSRAGGDVHPKGNPHFYLDPQNIPKISDAIVKRLCLLEPNACHNFQTRGQKFKQKWAKKQGQWAKRMAPLKGQKVVEYHRTHDYFLNHYGMNIINTLEPLPGIPPTPQHLSQIINQIKSQHIKWNIRCVYQPLGPSRLLSKRTKATLLTLPHDVGATSSIKNIFALYESILKGFGV